LTEDEVPMKIFIDFDDTIFNTARFKTELENIFFRFGITPEEFEATYLNYPQKKETGLRTYSLKNQIEKLEKLKIGFFYTFSLSSERKQILKSWRSKYMQANPADVFFAPSADDIIKTKAAFGCSHYARSFISIVKALGLVNNPKNMRYVITSKSDNYNQALETLDTESTINGHQFVIVKIASKWIAINTSKSEWTPMPDGFTPVSVVPPKNISIRFASYPEVTFLFRKIGKDFNDDCDDNSLVALMNIYRSGEATNSTFLWDKFDAPVKSPNQ